MPPDVPIVRTVLSRGIGGCKGTVGLLGAPHPPACDANEPGAHQQHRRWLRNQFSGCLKLADRVVEVAAESVNLKAGGLERKKASTARRHPITTNSPEIPETVPYANCVAIVDEIVVVVVGLTRESRD